MATKKAAKKKAGKKNGRNGAGIEEWTAGEKKVFNDFGVGWGDVSMRKLIRGQRSINSRFYETLELILDRMPKSKGKDEELDRVIALNKGVPGDSPGCTGG